MIVNFSKLIDPKEDLVTSKFCQFIAALSVRQTVLQKNFVGIY